MKTIACRFLNPTHGPYHGWEDWCEITYTVHGFKIKERECGTHGRVPIPPKPPATLEDFLALNGHRVDVELSRRVMRAAGQKPDDLPPKKRAPISKRPVEGHGTGLLIPDL